MADLRQLLDALVADESIPLGAEDLRTIEPALQPITDRGIVLNAVDLGPKTVCLIKAAVRLGLCIGDHENRRECVERFLEDAGKCYLPDEG